MSYILDALRRSDQLRRRGVVPTLPLMPAAPELPERQVLLRYGPFGLLPVVLASAALGWFGSWRTVADAAIPVSGPTQLAPPVPSPVPSPVAALAVTPPDPPAARKPPERIHYEPRAPAPTAVAAKREPPLKVSALRSTEAGLAPQDQPIAGSTVMSSSELPASIRQSLPPMPVAVHAYSATPRDRLVSINGRLLHEGDELATGLRLEQITPEGMVFSYRGYQFRRSAQ